MAPEIMCVSLDADIFECWLLDLARGGVEGARKFVSGQVRNFAQFPDEDQGKELSVVMANEGKCEMHLWCA